MATIRSVVWLQIIRKERSVGVTPSVPTIYEARLPIWPVGKLDMLRHRSAYQHGLTAAVE